MAGEPNSLRDERDEARARLKASVDALAYRANLQTQMQKEPLKLLGGASASTTLSNPAGSLYTELVTASGPVPDASGAWHQPAQEIGSRNKRRDKCVRIMVSPDYGAKYIAELTRPNT